MQADRSCSGVPIPADEVKRREKARQLKRRRATAGDHVRRTLCSTTDAPRLHENNIWGHRPHLSAESQLNNPHHVVQRDRNALLHVERVSDGGRQRSVDDDERHSRASVGQSISVQAELTGVDADDRSRSPQPDGRRRQSCNAVTLPRQRFTAFTIDSLLHAC